MKSRSKLIIIALIGCLSLISVGFAAWAITKPLDTYTGNVDMLVFEPYDNAQFIDITGSEVFDYYNTGFVENNVVISKTGTITASFKLKVSEYKNVFKDSTGMTIELLLKHASDSSGLDFFDESAPFTITATVSGELEEHASSSKSAQGCLTIIDLDTLPTSDEVAFTVTYVLEFDGSYSDFKTEVFEQLKYVRFAVEAKVTSK